MELNEKEFLRKNDITANRKVVRILICAMITGPLIALGRIIGVFETSYIFCLLITVIAAVECSIDWALCQNEKYYKVNKYFGLISVAILVGLMSTQFTVGINITYIFIPLVSCMYLDAKLTRNISIMCFVIMIVGLYFRSFGAVVREYSFLTHAQWFISQGLGFTIEYAFCTVALCSLTNYLKTIVKNYYEECVEKLSSSKTDQVKSGFIKNATSELRESLEQVDSLTSELLEDGSIETAAKKKVKQIATYNRLVHSKVKDMFDFSRIDLTKHHSTIRRYRVSSLVQEIKQAIEARLADKAIDFSVVVNPSIPNELIGDKVRIRQVMINLLNDSIHYQEDGFIIMKVDWKKKGEMAQLCIDVMDNTYEQRLQKAQEPTSTFSICKDLCENMNGRIEINSDYEKGSGFSVILPQEIADSKIIYGDVC